MSFRIEDKLYINENNLYDFKKYLENKLANKIYRPRIIESLYFDNHNFQIHNDSVEGVVPRKKIRVRKYPKNKDGSIYYEIKNSSVEGRFKTRRIIDSQELKELISKGIFDNQYISSGFNSSLLKFNFEEEDTYETCMKKWESFKRSFKKVSSVDHFYPRKWDDNEKKFRLI